MADTIDSDLADPDRGWKWQRFTGAAGEVMDDGNDSAVLVAKANDVGGSVARFGRTDASIADILGQTAGVDEFGEAHSEEEVEQFMVSNLYSCFRHGGGPMADANDVRRELMSMISACLAEDATARDFLAFAAPYALDELDDALRGDLDRLSLVADEVERFRLGEDVFLEAVRDVYRRNPSVDFAPAAD